MSDENLQEMELPSDAELFSGASEPETVQVETPEPETVTEQPRSPDGKFASREQEAKPAETPVETVPTTEKVDDSAAIPPWRLREIREARDEANRKLETVNAERARERTEFLALQQRLAALEKPQQAEPEPDPLLDPQGYAKRLNSGFEERLLNQERNFDMRLAHSKHGKVFEDAFTAAQQAMSSGDVQLRALMNNTSTPGETLIDWHKKQLTFKETGGDLNAWLEKKMEERLADPVYLAKAVEKARGVASASNPSGRPNVNLPPSLSNLTRGGDTVNTSEHLDPESDAALFAYANKK